MSTNANILMLKSQGEFHERTEQMQSRTVKILVFFSLLILGLTLVVVVGGALGNGGLR